MPFVFLLLFALVSLQHTQWPGPPGWLTNEGCALLVLAFLITSWLSASLIARTIAWQLCRQPENRSALAQSYTLWRRNHFIAMIVGYLAMVYLLGWGKVLHDFLRTYLPPRWQTEDNLPGLQLGVLMPFFLAVIASWERWHLVEREVYEETHGSDTYLGRWAYVVMQIRHQYFIVLPPMFVMTALQIMYVFVGVDDRQSHWPILAVIAFLAAAFIGMPWLLRLFLGLTPLPPGELRDRLEGAARRLGFGYSDILVWDTNNLVANAMVTGFIPWVRYIILTDRIIQDLSPDEIEAVFGHEVGHIEHHHLTFYLAFFMTSIVLFSLLWDELSRRISFEGVRAFLTSIPFVGDDDFDDLAGTLNSFGKLALLVPYMFVCFGYLSRRCERQADLFGAQTVSTDVFIHALEKVADINGIARDKWSWLHPSIDQRIEFLREMRDDPREATRFHRSLRWMQWGLYAGLVVLLVSAWRYDLLDVWKLLQ